MATILFHHQESDSYVEVEEADLDEFLATPDGAICTQIRGVAVPTPEAPRYAIVAAESVVAQVAARTQALIDAPEIKDQQSMNAVRAVVKETKKVWNIVDAERQRVKAPFLEACRRIDAAAKPLLDELQAVMNEGKHQEGLYLIERDRQLALEDEQRRLAELEAMKDTSRPTAPLIAPTLPAPLDAPLSTFKEVTIVNPALVPDEYWVIDRARVEADARAGKTIPGVTCTVVSRVTSR